MRSRQAFSAFAAAAIIFAALLRTTDPSAFLRYFGDLEPLVIITLAAALGWLAIHQLASCQWLSRGASRRGLGLAAAVATGFGLAIVGVDLIVVFPPDTNVDLPSALFFYSTMALVAEVVFHLLPLLGVSVAITLSKRRPPKEIPDSVIIAVALLEPIFQVAVGFSEPTPLWANVYVGAHVFALNLVQLILLRRHGFAAMAAVRLVYYLHWHLVWGQLRLELLF